MSILISSLPAKYQNQIAQAIYHAAIKPRSQVSNAKPKRHKAPTLGAAICGEAKSPARTIVRFEGFRVRPLDPDNFAGSVKDLLDGLRHAKLISGDEPWRIVLETEQVKVSSFKDERTEITIITP